MNKISFKWTGIFLVSLLFSCPVAFSNSGSALNYKGIRESNITAAADTSHMKTMGMKKLTKWTKDSTSVHKKAKHPKGSPYDTTMTPKK